MFLSDTHLPQILPPAAYVDDAWFKAECEGPLARSWHLVATTADVPAVGDFVTLRLLGRPLLVSHTEAGPRVFLNVCAHRLAQLTSAPSGRMCRLKCQYHGWEFDADGSTRKIPDAPGFRPLERGQFGLSRLETATCGRLIFARFARTGPTLTEFLGAEKECMEVAFAADSQPAASLETEVEANWKLVVENNLESYHVGEVHARTLGPMPDEKDCRHELTKNQSVFEAPGDVPGVLGSLQRGLLAGLGFPVTRRYRHCLLLPNLTWSRVDGLSAILTFEPLSATRTRLTLRGFFPPRVSHAPLRGWLLRQMLKVQMAFWKRVWEEDLQLYPTIQAGLASPDLPGTGLLSRREERVHHFQVWLRNRTGPVGSPPTAASEGIAHEAGTTPELMAEPAR
jgi:choline monooxygenase